MSDNPKPKPIQILEEKLDRLQRQRALETRVEEQMRLDAVIEDTQQQLVKAHQRLAISVFSIFGKKLAMGVGIFSGVAGGYFAYQQWVQLPLLPEMVAIPSGAFVMGCLEPRDLVKGIVKRCFEHEKHLAKPIEVRGFQLSSTEITFFQWDACVAEGGCNGYTPADHGWGRGSHPVINVSWLDTKDYLRWLSSKTGKRYRLPTEIEWEYAARAGEWEKNAYSWGSEPPACDSNAKNGARFDGAQGKSCSIEGKESGTAKVASYKPNAYGLYDMHGNVWEWCADPYIEYGKQVNTLVNPEQTAYVLRGGSWVRGAEMLRSAYRYTAWASERSDGVGFRVALDIE
ncbi:MAG: SUMF1/EgtB/PvdO family nonheme iron enzyme [Thiofilum sp.]|uniref:formylglycine-generating enzyme family protein n=1 Tax=Thiofilum sp. TaxID=2212733 RepID=UPI0025E5A71D|nr:SUMF1/EgtB/PvdO family nonheme iron enzyme [Thiofilum sp.]MBK8454906.1 SUMF1/EgtB/PvdO family nonheme iron enzyme [Thiofilum sp.]